MLTGDPATAIGAFEDSLKLDPEVPARYYLAYAYAQRGRMDEARAFVNGHSFFGFAIQPGMQALLKAITP